ncbi:bifunctional homocysteine S-methyltransferase/methylenetetrahydrofolate reductase [Bacillus ginsengihumi]|uniref:Bifunctional homocysteine S-methyltransferase/methylenetetrahydrofolate reductase n=1 Tax=Heyndrickxia ginsengihumi TaxID=363870 RepID=A0A6M0PB54_9BACI|nr:bifunctional homocysteine S-methyltransferase/methylenetetrahydrofolate reductase [Heyndrickxia ginsengihumi]MBE6184309.1 bifunctional homocysteine S-methyltransferase/methylenetetrahydrofolate reductase [Bacillus sp. (in: firmicutes)]MCM3024822.1 bifunctional homocysteine S-methyltransferase/methylenetetrahydrofolate reductase [Heyndrickxia ginsengihumi]NEY21625.1 bifunctional homocysteine S-methyltransferase/methylenetetrahydrofolate reductase [Heyndrickxia ginsengihumi]
MGLIERLKNEILIADGAMGTLLYSYGIDFGYEELNVTNPSIIERIHRDYLEAGADIIQTNTYSANAIKLARYGLENDVKKINNAAVSIAKKSISSSEQYVIGTLGGIRGIRKNSASMDEISAAFTKQLDILLEGNLDGFLLETYYDFEELTNVLKIARSMTDLPIIAQVSMHEPGFLQNGLPLNSALEQLEILGADVIGVNCHLGPYHTCQAFDQVTLPKKAFLSAYPNASLLDVVDERIVYKSTADYFGKLAVELRNQGVRLIGGCCGTTPDHIAAVKKALKGLLPITEKEVEHPRESILIEDHAPTPPSLVEKVKKQRSVIVELDTTKHLETTTFFKGAKSLQEAGIDALTMADNSLASPRISNMAMATLLQTNHNIRPLVHITCRDRNIIGLQSHLMGLHALGIHDILAITGDPSKIGDFPGATSVYDVSSTELLQLIKQLNEGISFSGKPLKTKTNFTVAAAFNPNVRLLDRAVKRLERKIKAGADYFISQPVFSIEKIEEMYEATKHLSTPIYIGILPLTSSRNAEFLHNEVPGIQLSEEILMRMKAWEHDKVQAEREGIKIAKELIDVAARKFNGIYLITPFLRYHLTTELVTYIHDLDATITKGDANDVQSISH